MGEGISLLQVEIEVGSPHGTYCHYSGWTSLSASNNRSASSTWLSLILGGVLECIIQPHKARSLDSPFNLLLAWVGVGSEVFCGVWLEESSYCLNVLLLIAYPFPGSLDRDTRCLLGLFLSSANGIVGLPASAPNLRWGKKKIQRVHHCVISWILMSPASLPSFHLFWDLC